MEGVRSEKRKREEGYRTGEFGKEIKKKKGPGGRRAKR
jgi:hypothetical protein